MYINVGIGNVNNQKPFNFVSYDFSANSLKYWDYNAGAVKPIDQASTSNYGVKKWPILNQEGTQIADGAIALFIEPQYMENNSHPEIKDNNQSIIDGLGFGLFNSEQDSIITKAIQYTNRVSGQGYSSSESNVEYTEVTPTEEAPQNWEEERLYAYFFGSEQGTGQQVAYTYRQIAPTYYEWNDIYAYLQNNPGIKLYKNTELSKRIVIGTAEKCVSFNVTKGDYSPGSSYMYPFVTMYGRSANVNSPGTYSGGMIIAGDDPTDPAYSLWVSNNNPFNTQGFGYFTQASTDQLTPFYTNGRLSTSAPATKAHPVTECTLFQFGQMKYNGKTYIGVWRVTYKAAYYWGYLSTSQSSLYNPGSWSALSDTEVVYNAQMNTYDRIQKIAFNGICLDDIDVVPDIHEGKIPVPPKPGPGSGSYDYPSFPHDVWHTKAFNVLATPTESGFHIYYMNKNEFATFIAEISRWSSFARQMAKNASDLWSDVVSSQSLGEMLLNMFFSADNTTTAILNTSVDFNSTIVFCRKMPNFVSEYAITNPGYPLKIGTGTIDGLYPNYFVTERIVCLDDTQFHFNADLDSLGFQTATFYDLEPYVQAKLFLPYYGEVTLPISSFIDGSILVSYAADVCSGNGGVLVITTDKDGNNCTFGPYQCDISVNIPLAVTDANAQGRMQSMTKAAVTTAVAAATGGTGVALAGALSTLDAAAQKRVNQTISTLGSNNGFLTPENIILQLTYPATIPDKDGEKNLDATISQIGASSYQNGKVSEFLTGKITKYTYVNTNGINATEAEKRAIEALLKGGVY